MKPCFKEPRLNKYICKLEINRTFYSIDISLLWGLRMVPGNAYYGNSGEDIHHSSHSKGIVEYMGGPSLAHNHRVMQQPLCLRSNLPKALILQSNLKKSILWPEALVLGYFFQDSLYKVRTYHSKAIKNEYAYQTLTCWGVVILERCLPWKPKVEYWLATTRRKIRGECWIFALKKLIEAISRHCPFSLFFQRIFRFIFKWGLPHQMIFF